MANTKKSSSSRSKSRSGSTGRKSAARRKKGSRRYGKLASEKVGKAMHERKRGQLKSGRSGKTVKSRKQAIAIGLSEARARGGKVPKRRKRSK